MGEQPKNTPPPVPLLIVVTGMSGSGKSIALRALEDLGYYCVDNLPPQLLLALVQLQAISTDLLSPKQARPLAIAVDVRSVAAWPDLSHSLITPLNQLRSQGVQVHTLFLEAATPVLIQRFSETRRRHPLSTQKLSEGLEPQGLMTAIEQERDMLAPLREWAHVVDTDLLRSSQLQAWVREWVHTVFQTSGSGVDGGAVNLAKPRLTLVFESFAFKRGVPLSADFVFDVRMLPNPYYELELRDLSGRDQPVITFLEAQPSVQQMQADIMDFLSRWLPKMHQDHRAYVTVAIGCTGGQHRSVFLAEQLAHSLHSVWITLVRHRELI
jgi:UPF0042 nucleotide-binding protein